MTFKLQPNQKLNTNIWSSLNNYNGIVIAQKVLNYEQLVEFDKIKNLTEQLIIDNYNRNPIFNHLKKTSNGYSVYRRCFSQSKHNTCNWYINIDINRNEAIVSLSSNDCTHNIAKKKTSLIFGLYI